MLEIHKITLENINKLENVYNEFKSLSFDYYKIETAALEFAHFKRGVELNILKGFYASFEEEPIGFLFYVLEEHRAIEINIIHVTKEFHNEDIEFELLEEFLEEARNTEGWDVISYPMLGGQSRFVHKMTHLGFKLIGQAIVRFNMADMISPQIVGKLSLDDMPDEWSIDQWRPQYLDGAGEVIYESFHTAPDAKFDPRFRTHEGSKNIVKMLVDSVIGDFQPKCTSVLIKDGKPCGICFGNLTTPQKANVPLIGLMPEAQGKGFSLHLLKNTILCFINEVIEARLDCMEINATVETDNYPALKMYRRLGFREDYHYPHAYLTNENI